MYKILIRNRDRDAVMDVRLSKYSIYYDVEEEFATSDLNEALDKVNKLLDRYLRKDIILIDTVDTTSKVTSNEIKVIDITSDLVVIVNDGANFTFALDLGPLNDYSIVNISESYFERFKDYLEELGLTEVEYTSNYQIRATNKSGQPVVGIYPFEQGFFTLFSRQSSLSSYITSAFTTTLDTKGSGEIVDPTTKRYIDLRFVDEDNNPLLIEKVSLFYRGGNSRHDREYTDVSEIHTEVRNNGKYLIEVEKEGYIHNAYYEVEFPEVQSNPIIIQLTKDVVDRLLDELNGEVI